MTGKGKISEWDWWIRKLLPGSRIKGLTRHPLLLELQALKISVQKIPEISMVSLSYVNFPHSQFPKGIFINEFSKANFHYLRNETKKLLETTSKHWGKKKEYSLIFDSIRQKMSLSVCKSWAVKWENFCYKNIDMVLKQHSSSSVIKWTRSLIVHELRTELYTECASQRSKEKSRNHLPWG